MKYMLVLVLLITSGIPAAAGENVKTNQRLLTRCKDCPCSCKKRCHNCPKDDPMEETLTIVLAAIPDVFAKFIQIIQNPHNEENLVQSLCAIFAHIIRIATSAFKRDELDQNLRTIILSQAIPARALTCP